MITLFFLICTAADGCFPVANENIFFSVEDCRKTAEEVIKMHQEEAALGKIPPHTADYQCIHWGLKT